MHPPALGSSGSCARSDGSASISPSDGSPRIAKTAPLRRRAVVFHIGGVVLTAMGFALGLVALVVGLTALAFVSLLGSYCAPEAPDSLALHLKVGCASIVLGVALVPALWTIIAWRTRRAWKPWAATVGVVVAPGLVLAALAQPGLAGPLGACS
jgi:hypothetical protein